MKMEEIKSKLEDLCNNYIVNGTVFGGLFKLFKSIRERILRHRLLSLLKKMKKLKKLTKNLDNSILNIIEGKLKNSNFSEEEYLEHIYILFNENMSDINKWKDKKREIELKRRNGVLTQEDMQSLLILNKSIKLANDINKDLMSLFIEMTKDRQYSRNTYMKTESLAEIQDEKSQSTSNRGSQAITVY